MHVYGLSSPHEVHKRIPLGVQFITHKAMLARERMCDKSEFWTTHFVFRFGHTHTHALSWCESERVCLVCMHTQASALKRELDTWC